MNARTLRLIIAMVIGGVIGALLVTQRVIAHATIKRNLVTIILLCLLLGIMTARSFIRANKKK